MSSRRKQGRPQQRKILDSVEAENDLLVCGHCQTSFALRDIVHFIKHKNHSCSKENLALNHHNHHHHDDDDNDNDDEDDEEEEERPTDLSQTTPGGRKMEGVEEGGKGKGGGGKDVGEKEKIRKPLRPRQVTDAEANTTHSEPSRFVCETCGLTVGSAWGLLQHAQKEHGMRIYNTGTPAAGTAATTQTAFLATPQPAHTRPVPQALPAHQRTPEVTSASPHHKAERPTLPTATAGTGPTATFPGVLNPFFRLPAPFTRTSELHIPVDVLEQYRLQPQLLGTVGVTISRAAVESPIAHAAFDRTRPLDSQQTYSQRLKELANPTLAATLISPQTSASFTPPVLKPLQPNAQDSGRAGRDSTSSSTSSSSSSGGSGTVGQGGEVKVVKDDKRKEKVTAAKEKNDCSPISKLSSAVSMHLPGKLKTCEFCQKKFRFQSNLIVHRRSHTGEKPFQCPLCPHACSQQSKLRRHMKTHSNGARNGSLTSSTATVSSDGSTHSTSSSPDSTRHKLDDASDMDDEEDVDVEEDDEDEEEDMEEDFTDGDYDSELDKGCDNSFNPLTAESNGRSDVCSNSQADTPDAEQAATPTKQRSASASLISEVMKNSGLNCIQSYNEAFQAALEENIGKEAGVQDLSCKENGESESSKRPANGQTASAKSVKDESADTNSQETGLPSGVFSPSSFTRCLPADCSSSTFRTFFPGFPPTFTLQTAEGGSGSSSDKQTGSSGTAVLGVLAVSDSALKVPSASSVSLTSVAKPVSGASLLAASTANSPVTRKSGGRNDTCEFCGKVFKNCSNLTVHRRSHTGEKPYKCELCTYACAQSSKLTRHMKTHGRVGKDVFRCRFCDMPFSVPSTLEKHMRKCVENRNTRVLASPEKGEDGEGGKGGMDQDSGGSQSSPAPSMPTLSAQLQRQGPDSKTSAAQDSAQEDDASPGQPAAAVTSPAAQESPGKESSGPEEMEVQPDQA